MTLDSRRFQFSITRLMACTIILALVAWLASFPLPTNFPRDGMIMMVFRVTFIVGLLTAAVGMLLGGRIPALALGLMGVIYGWMLAIFAVGALSVHGVPNGLLFLIPMMVAFAVGILIPNKLGVIGRLHKGFVCAFWMSLITIGATILFRLFK